MRLFMQNFSLSGIALMCALSFHTQAHESAARFSVQVGAFTTAAEGLRQSLAEYGSVHVEQSGELSRYMVGDFGERSAAVVLRDELRRAGFGDAFVRSLPGSASASGAEHRHASGEDQARLDALSPEQRANAVYLDGVLHIKQGNTFTPVD